jgi:hypothetical protein
MNVFMNYQGDNLLLTIGTETVTVNRNTNPAFDRILYALNDGDYDTVLELANPARALAKFYSDTGDTVLEVFGSRITINGKNLPEAISNRLMDIFEAGLPLNPIANFLERLYRNPSATSRRELLLFLEGNDLPLTPDGCFMAYKSAVNWDGRTELDDSGRKFAKGDFQSFGTNRQNGLPTRLRLGDEIRMDRGEVDDCRQNTCSFGYHFASFGYASTFGSWDALLLMKIDPADVVSIPNDYDNQKGRTCAYTLHGVHTLAAEEEPEDTLSEVPVFDAGDSGRWEIRDNDTNSVLARFSTRDNARENRRNMSDYHRERCHLFDSLNQQVIR